MNTDSNIVHIDDDVIMSLNDFFEISSNTDQQNNNNEQNCVYFNNQTIKDGYGKITNAFLNETYEGEFKNYSCNGHGRLTFENGTYCEGTWSNNVMNKTCKIFYNNGNFYEGETHFKSVWCGLLISSPKLIKCRCIRQGFGKKIYSNGEIFEGVWDKGNKVHGKMTYQNGDVYYGDFIDNEKNGDACKMEFSNGNVYEGNFYNDDIHGKGTMKYMNGDIYEGEFKHNLLHGTGIMNRANGDIEEGSWDNGNYYGNGYVSYVNKNVKIVYMDTLHKYKNFALVFVENCQYIQVLNKRKIIDVIKIPFEISSFDDLVIKLNDDMIHNLDVPTLCCPISFDVMIDPVITSCNHTFCKKQLEKCDNICPLCRQRILYYFPNSHVIDIYRNSTFMMNNVEMSYDDYKNLIKLKELNII